MKKNFLTIALSATAVAMAVSCANKENTEPQVSERVPMQFAAGSPELTKTAIAEDGTSVVWSEGDAIGVFDTQINKFDIIAGAGTSSGRFSGFALPDAEYYALYPYDTDAAIAGGIIIFQRIFIENPCTEAYRHCGSHVQDHESYRFPCHFQIFEDNPAKIRLNQKNP